VRGLVGAALVAAVCVLALPGVAAAQSPLLVGAAEDAAKWSTDPKAKLDLAKLAGLGAVRMTSTWTLGQTAPSAPEVSRLQNASTAAAADGIRPIVAIYNSGSSNTPTTSDSRAQLAQYAAALARALPNVPDFVVGNEPNDNTFWAPQFNADATDAAASAYEDLLARSYDAIKAVRPDARVLGGALAPRGGDVYPASKATHSPTSFIRDLGAAYRASGRTVPLMDVFDMHVYEDYSALPPSFAHPSSTTISVPDYGKLVALLGQAFDGTAQRGSTLPILYGEFGVESAIPAAKAGVYSGTEPAATHAVDEATQAAYYREAFKVATCQANVIGMMIFHVSDESALAAWQSGPFYADDAAKSSLPAIRDSAAAARAGTLTSCPDSTAPTAALTAPTAGATFAGSVTLSATAADDVGVGKVSFLVDGTVVATKFAPPYSVAWASGASGPHTLTVQAQDAAGNVGTSAPVPVTVDNTPPETTISSGPGATSPESTSFAFDSSEGGSRFECSLDGAAFAACSSPAAYTLAPGPHTFAVRAIDAVGNVDASPASAAWTVLDTTPPQTTISSGPSGTTLEHAASFAFAASETGTFECSLDGAAFAACSSPVSYAGLADGAHTFAVRATDTAGNADPTPASRSWTVLSRPPNDAFDASIALAPGGASVSGSNANATKQAGEPNHAGVSGGHSVWYRWTPAKSTWVTIDTVGSAYDTTLAVYTGNSVSALTKVAANNDASSWVRTSRVRFSATGGRVYRIAVDGRSSATGALTLNLKLG